MSERSSRALMKVHHTIGTSVIAALKGRRTGLGRKAQPGTPLKKVEFIIAL
jgi:hypothetical protein